MRFRIMILLAVCSNLAAAGPLRRTGARVLQQNVARFLNHTEIPSVPADNIVFTPAPIAASSVTSSIAASSEISDVAATSFTKTATTRLTPTASSSTLAPDALVVSTPSQTASISATSPSTLLTTEQSGTASDATPLSTSAPVYSGRLFNLGGEPPVDLQSSTNTPSPSSTPSSSRSSLTSSDAQSTFDIQKVAATPSSSSLALSHASSSSEVPLPISSTAAPIQTSSSFATIMPTSHPAAATQIPSSVVVPVPISSGLIQVVGPGGDTADEFAPVTLDLSLPAPTGTMTYPSAEGGNVAMADGFNYAFGQINRDTPCNPGDPSQAYVCIEGEIAECQSDQTYVVKSCPSRQTCKALPKPSGQTGIIVQCIVPSDAASILADSSSSTAAPVAVASQHPELLQPEGDFSQATQSVGAQNSVQPLTSSLAAQPTIQSQKVAPTSSVPAGMAAVQQVQDPNPLNESPTSEAAPSTPLTIAAKVTPSFFIPKPLFAVVTAAQAPQPSPEVSSPAIQPSATPPSASTDSTQATEAIVANTSISSAESASITYAPMGVPVNEKAAVGNGQATVTVTVTVTTTEKTAPVTIISS